VNKALLPAKLFGYSVRGFFISSFYKARLGERDLPGFCYLMNSDLSELLEADISLCRLVLWNKTLPATGAKHVAS
jgi:hypothetical protein